MQCFVTAYDATDAINKAQTQPKSSTTTQTTQAPASTQLPPYNPMMANGTSPKPVALQNAEMQRLLNGQ